MTNENTQSKNEYIKAITTKGGNMRWNSMTAEQRKAHIQLMIDSRKKKKNAAIERGETIEK
jgi:predicted Fe-S protein YdhL (DUF1289 family)